MKCVMVTYHFNQLEELELAYAVTVHKSQGSEFPIVIMPISWFPPMLATRNLLYTGVTRGNALLYSWARRTSWKAWWTTTGSKSGILVWYTGCAEFFPWKLQAVMQMILTRWINRNFRGKEMGEQGVLRETLEALSRSGVSVKYFTVPAAAVSSMEQGRMPFRDSCMVKMHWNNGRTCEKCGKAPCRRLTGAGDATAVWRATNSFR